MWIHRRPIQPGPRPSLSRRRRNCSATPRRSTPEIESWDLGLGFEFAISSLGIERGIRALGFPRSRTSAWHQFAVRSRTDPIYGGKSMQTVRVNCCCGSPRIGPWGLLLPGRHTRRPLARVRRRQKSWRARQDSNVRPGLEGELSATSRKQNRLDARPILPCRLPVTRLPPTHCCLRYA